MRAKKIKILKILTCFTLILLSLACTIIVYADKNKDKKFTGNWQFVNSMEDIPCSGHVLLSYARDSSKLFYGELGASDNKSVSDSLDNLKLQIQDDTDKSFMLIQNGQQFYIQLCDGTYLKREGNLTDAHLVQVNDISEATAFRIEQAGLGTNNYSYYKIFEPYELTSLSLVVTDGNIGLSNVSHSGFYMMAEATKVKEPPFGDFTRIAKFIATMIAVVILIVIILLYKNNILNLITFGISTLCTIALLVLFMVFAITTEVPGLYVLHKSTFNAEPVEPYEFAEAPKTLYEIVEDGSAIFSFSGEDNSPYIWNAKLDEGSIFTTTSSGQYYSGLYTIWLRPYGSGNHEIVFYYYDVTKGIEQARNALKFYIEINDQNQITSIQPVSSEV